MTEPFIRPGQAPGRLEPGPPFLGEGGKLELSRPLLSAVVQQCRAAAPEEACGLIAGIGRRARRVYPIDNVHSDPEHRYTMHPEQLVTALFDINQRGLELVAIFHSHPGGPAVPSARDINEALWPDAVYVIVSLDADPERHGARAEGSGAAHPGATDFPSAESTFTDPKTDDSSAARSKVRESHSVRSIADHAKGADLVEIAAFRIDRERRVAIPVTINIR